jgi:ribulose-5-phosphate 4-epimerase/fuculose-1-phosphate aldolase
MCSRAVGDLTPLATAVSETVSRSVSLDDPAVAAYGICVLVPYHGLFVAAATLRRAVYFINKLEENAQLVLASTGLAFGSAK